MHVLLAPRVRLILTPPHTGGIFFVFVETSPQPSQQERGGIYRSTLPMLELLFLYYVLDAMEQQQNPYSDRCAICKKPLHQGAPPASRRKTCSNKCRQRLSRQRRKQQSRP